MKPAASPTTTPRVEWGTLVPAEVRAGAEPLVMRWLGCVPSWCHTLKVLWDDEPDDPEWSAYTTPKPDYREAGVWLCPRWLRLSADERDRTMRHELAHLPTAGMEDVFDRLLKQVKKANPQLHEDYAEQWRQASEGTTCDIAAAYGAVRGESA